MSEKLFDALEVCLRAIENGETIDSALKRFPALADELRPLLDASLHARRLGGFAIPEGVQRRGRSKLVQRTAELRASKRTPRRTWVFTFRPAVVTLILVIFLLTGTGLVRASNGAIPGDNLYPVKRTWEDVTLMFAANQQHRDQLELTYETERVGEVQELLAKGRSETVSFVGYVSAQGNGQWTVAGVPVIVDAGTVLPAEPIIPGTAVMVTGATNGSGVLVAQRIVTVAAGAVVPDIEDGHQNSSGGDGEDHAGSASSSNLKGTIQSVNGNLWVVGGQNVDVSGVAVTGSPAVGASVSVEGYYNSDGVFVATQVSFSSDSSSSNSSSDEKNNDGKDNGSEKDGHDD